MLPKLRAGVAHLTGGVGEAWRHVLHREFTECLVHHGHDRLARLEVRIGEHFRRAVDAPRRDAVLFHQTFECLSVDGASPVGDEIIKLLLVLSPCGVRLVAHILGERGAAHRLAQSFEHTVLVGADDQHQIIFGRINVGRRDVGQDCSRPLADVVALLIFGNERLHHRQHGLVDRAVDNLPAPGARARVHRHHGAERCIGGRQAVADRNAHAARRHRGITDNIAQAAHCLADRAETRTLRIRVRSARSRRRAP